MVDMMIQEGMAIGSWGGLFGANSVCKLYMGTLEEYGIVLGFDLWPR